MVQIPDSLRSVFTGRVRDHDGRYVIEIPTNEVDQGTVANGRTYRVAILGTPSSSDESSTKQPSGTQGNGQEDDPYIPVEEGEIRQVTIRDVGEQGDGIAKVDSGYVVIVPGGKPGERPTIKITEARETVAFSEIVKQSADSD